MEHGISGKQADRETGKQAGILRLLILSLVLNFFHTKILPPKPSPLVGYGFYKGGKIYGITKI